MFDPYYLYEEKTNTKDETPTFSLFTEMNLYNPNISKLIDTNASNETNFFLQMGTRFNELMLYDLAIEYLNKAIALQPNHKEADLAPFFSPSINRSSC